ncbi:MAG: hypothetical protein V1887_04025 [Candidatus Aenigmatarchaeota archaeon]
MMNWKTVLKEWKILLLLVMVAGSLLLVAPVSSEGVVVKSVSVDSPLAGKLAAGERLTWMNEQTITKPADVYQFENFTGTLRFIHDGKLDLAQITRPGLGLTIEGGSSSKLSFGLDLVGGTRVLLKPTKNVSSAIIDQTIATLQTRINIYGLREAKFQAVNDVEGNRYVQIEMAGATPAEVENLLAKQGTFEAKIPKILHLSNGTSTLLNRTVSVEDGKLVLDGKRLSINDTFSLGGIEWEYTNSTKDEATVLASVMSGSDIRSVCLIEQAGVCTSRVQKVEGGYEFVFQITTSEEASQHFADVTRGMPSIVNPQSGSAYLESRIYFYIDGKDVTDLTISSDLAGRALTDPSITGFRTTRDEALKEKLGLQSILQSGALPVSLDVIRMDSVSATLGADFLRSTELAGLIAAGAVAAVILFRYRRWKIVVPMVAVSFSEVVIILGGISIINYTLDLAAIAGIIATLGTSVDAQIMVIDELIAKERMYTFKQRLKRAFFMIFGSAGTVVAAMLPLAIIGIGVMRGFAIVTMMGVFIGILVTRPAFARIAEVIIEREERKAQTKPPEPAPPVTA